MGKRLVRVGDVKPPESRWFYHDGERFWQHESDFDEQLGDYVERIVEVDPHNGKKVRTSVPAWFEKTDGGELQRGLSELMVVDGVYRESPLGSKGNMVGWKTVKRRDGSYFGEGIDGRRWDIPITTDTGRVHSPVGLIQQPGTNEFLPISTLGSHRQGKYWIWDPEGNTAIANIEDFQSQHANGQPTVLPLHFWHLLKPRHLPSSKKLRKVSKKQCASLYAAAEAADKEEKNRVVTEQQKKDKVKFPNSFELLLPAVQKFLPKAPLRLQQGVARIVWRAHRHGSAFVRFREKQLAESKKADSRSSLIVNQKIDSAAQAWHTRSDNLEGSVGTHLPEVTAFLNGESKAGPLTPTNFMWFRMLDDIRGRCWKTFWRIRSEKDDNSWLDFLKFWNECGIAEMPGEFATMSGFPENAKKKRYSGYEGVEVTSGKSFTIKNGDDLFIVIEDAGYGEEPYRFLRYSTAKKPGTPPGYKVKDIKVVNDGYDRKDIDTFIAAVETAKVFPLPSKDELAGLAERLASSPGEVALVWLHGLGTNDYAENFLPSAVRNQLKLKVTDASAARQALSNQKRTMQNKLFASVLSMGVAAPFAEDRTPVLNAIEKTWGGTMPKRLPLEADLQKRFAKLKEETHWHGSSDQEFFEAAADPKSHKMLTPSDSELEFEMSRGRPAHLAVKAKKKNEKALHDGFVNGILKMVAMLHGETIGNHPARTYMPTLIKSLTKVINSPKSMIQLRQVYLWSYGNKKVPEPSEWLSTSLGKLKVNQKEKTATYDDGLLAGAAIDGNHVALVAFRPGKMKSQADINRLLGITALQVGEYNDGNPAPIAHAAAFASTGFQKLVKDIVAYSKEEVWPQNPLVSSAETVASIEKKMKLSQDASVLYAQLLALPIPTTANIKKWNGWTPARIKKATEELTKQKLVLEAKRARAGRNIFLPGEWLELKAPWLPIEAWKLPHLYEMDLDTTVNMPADGPMILRPFDELFAAAWQRVLDGDEPKYEEVKRKKR